MNNLFRTMFKVVIFLKCVFVFNFYLRFQFKHQKHFHTRFFKYIRRCNVFERYKARFRTLPYRKELRLLKNNEF